TGSTCAGNAREAGRDMLWVHSLSRLADWQPPTQIVVRTADVGTFLGLALMLMGIAYLLFGVHVFRLITTLQAILLGLLVWAGLRTSRRICASAASSLPSSERFAAHLFFVSLCLLWRPVPWFFYQYTRYPDQKQNIAATEADDLRIEKFKVA